MPRTILFPWYRPPYGTVIPSSHVFATLTALGEIGIGLSLLFGLLTPLGAFFGLIQVLFYGMAVQQQSSGQQGFHVMLFILMSDIPLCTRGTAMGARCVAAQALARLETRTSAHVARETRGQCKEGGRAPGRPLCVSSAAVIVEIMDWHPTPCAGGRGRVFPSCER